MAILATVALAAAQIMWRVMRQPRRADSATEWTADE
jgi:hypothetical protein